MMITLLDSLIGLAAFWLILLFLSSRINFHRFNILIAPLLIVWRSERLGNMYNRLSKGRSSRYIQIIGTGSSILYLSLFVTVPIILFINIILSALGRPSTILANNPINFIDSSIFIIIFPLFIALFAHEIGKLIMATSEGAKVEKAGLMLIVVIIAPFIQFTNKSIRALKRRSRLRILTIGMLANLLLLLLFIPLLANQSSIVSNYYEKPSGAMIVSIDPNSPAAFTLQTGNVIIGIQILEFQTVVRQQNITSSLDFISALRNIPSGDNFILILQGFRIIIQGIDPPEGNEIIAGSYLGVEVYDFREPKYDLLNVMLPFYFEEFLIWSISINLILGLFNIMPLPLSDGDKFLTEILNNSAIKNTDKLKIRKITYLTSILLIWGNIYYTIL